LEGYGWRKNMTNVKLNPIERMFQLRDILERTGFNEKVHSEVDYNINAYLHNKRW